MSQAILSDGGAATMAEFWIRKHGGGDIQGPVTSAQLKALAKKGNLLPADEVGKSQSGPWNQAAKIKGLQFGAETEKSADSPAHFEEVAEPPAAPVEEHDDAPEAFSDTGFADDSEMAPPFINVHSESDEGDQPNLITATSSDSPRAQTRTRNDSLDNKYPALRIIVMIQKVLGWICLAFCALALLGWFYFVISYVLSSNTVSDAEVDEQLRRYREIGLEADREAVREELEREKEGAGSGGLIAGSVMYWLSMVSTAFAALYFFAFAQIITLFMDIERNTRSG